MNAGDVSAVLVTRGDVDLSEIVASVEDAGITDLVIWNNQLEQDLAVYGRYAAIEQARNEIVYVQDDDCVVPALSLLLGLAAQYDLSMRAVCNMPVSRWSDYSDSALVGWGALFHRDLPAIALGRFANAKGVDRVLAAIEQDPGFYHRTCDVVFTTLTPTVKVDVGFRHLPWAEQPGRMFTSPGHSDERARMLELARQVRDAAATRSGS